MRKSTINDLPVEIESLIPENERTPLINQIITEARAGEFHDFRNQKYVCGKVQVHAMLLKTGDKRFEPLMKAIINGEYDEPANEDDLAAMKKDWIADGGTAESFQKLFGPKIK